MVCDVLGFFPLACRMVGDVLGNSHWPTGWYVMSLVISQWLTEWYVLISHWPTEWYVLISHWPT